MPTKKKKQLYYLYGTDTGEIGGPYETMAAAEKAIDSFSYDGESVLLLTEVAEYKFIRTLTKVMG